MTDIKTRLEHGAATLAVIDYRRRETRDQKVGAGLERYILERELNELAEDGIAAPLGAATAVVDARKRLA